MPIPCENWGIFDEIDGCLLDGYASRAEAEEEAASFDPKYFSVYVAEVRYDDDGRPKERKK